MACKQRNTSLAASFSAGLLLALAQPAAAQNMTPATPAANSKAAPAAKTDNKAEKKNSDVALKAYSAGTRAFESGKTAEAVDQLSTALVAGGLPPNQMAKALYYRGAAYRKQSKPALAISDLTSALWLKGGLSDADRALASDARQAAYREAGLGDTAPAIPAQQTAATVPAAVPAPGASPASAGTPPVPVAAAPAPAGEGALPWGQPSTGVKPAAGSASLNEPVTTLGTVPEPVRPAAVQSLAVAPAIAQPSPIPDSAPSPAASSWAPATAPQPAAANVAAFSAAPADEAASVTTAAPMAGTGQAVAGFFNNMGSSIGKMFGGGSNEAGSQATQTASSPVQTSSTGPVYASAADTNAAASSWGDVVVTTGQTKAGATRTAALEPAIVAPAAGQLLLQVAAVRSREEADRVVTRLKGTPAVKSANAGTDIDEAVIGNMGTFFRVRVGPFANAADPDKLCGVLKPEGYDCLVVSR